MIFQYIFLENWKIQKKTMRNVYQLCLSTNFAKNFLSVVHRKLALLVSFCMRKADFSALVRKNFKCAENQLSARKTTPTQLTSGIHWTVIIDKFSKILRYVSQIFRETFCKFKKLSHMYELMYNLVTWSDSSMALIISKSCSGNITRRGK